MNGLPETELELHDLLEERIKRLAADTMNPYARELVVRLILSGVPDGWKKENGKWVFTPPEE